MESITLIFMIIILCVLLYMAYRNRRQITTALYNMCHSETMFDQEHSHNKSNPKSILQKYKKRENMKVNVDNISQISDISLETPREKIDF